MGKPLGESLRESLEKSRRPRQPAVVASARDTSSMRPQHLRQVRRLEALVDGQRQVLQMISQGRPLAQILEAIARWIETQSRDGVLVSLLLLDHEGQRLLQGAAPSLPQAYNDAIHGLQIGPAVGSCGTAAFTKHLVVVEDIALDPLWVDLRDLALAHDLRACWSAPLIGRTGRVLGTFAMYYRQPRRPTADDRHIIQLITQTAVLAIEHHQAEEERQRAEAAAAYLAAIVTSAEDAIASKTLDGIVTSWNASAERMFGYTAEEMIGQPILRLFPANRRDEEDLILARIRAGERIEHFETVRLTKDGHLLDVSLTISPIRDSTGSIIGASKIVRDITERKRLERRTRESLDALLEVAATMVSDPVEGSDIPQQSVLGSPGSAQHADLALQRFATLCSRVLSCEQVAIVAIEPGTELLRTVALIGNAPEQERRFRAGFSGLRLADRFGAEIAAQLLSGETVLVDVNRLRQDDPARLLSRRFFLLAPIRAAGVGPLQGYIGVNFGDEARHYTTENRALALVVAHLVGIVMERARLTREREEARARETALAESKQQMDEFLSMASHELRTPLTSVTANVQLARRQLRALAHVTRNVAGNAIGNVGRQRQNAAGDTASTDEKASVAQAGFAAEETKIGRAALLLERTEQQLRRLDRLVGDLLDASRIQAGRLELRVERCDLLALLRDGVEAQRAAWPGRVISLDLPPYTTLPLDADPDRISQVVTNFLTNALKYSAADQPVAVRVRMQGDTARVEVHDHGPGLSVEQQSHLFERFYRVPGIEQQSGSGVGLGLGLYICKTIIERHGGAVGVASAPGEGSAFWCTLPTVMEPAGGTGTTGEGRR